MTDTIEDDAPFFAWLELQREIVELQLQEDGDVELPVTANHLSDFMFYYDRLRAERDSLRRRCDELNALNHVAYGCGREDGGTDIERIAELEAALEKYV